MSFTFPGNVGRCDKGKKLRVAKGKPAMIGLEKIWKNKHVCIETKKDSEVTDFPEFCTAVRCGQ